MTPRRSHPELNGIGHEQVATPDGPRAESGDGLRPESGDGLRPESGDGLRAEPRDESRNELRDESQDEARPEPRDETPPDPWDETRPASPDAEPPAQAPQSPPRSAAAEAARQALRASRAAADEARRTARSAAAEPSPVRADGSRSPAHADDSRSSAGADGTRSSAAQDARRGIRRAKPGRARAAADADVHSARGDAEVHSARAAADVHPARADAEVHPGPAITDVHPAEAEAEAEAEADAEAHPAPAAADAHPSRSDAEAGPAPALVGPVSTNPVEPHPALVAPADVRSLFRGSDDARPVRTAPSDIRPELGAPDDRHPASRGSQPVLPAPDDPRPARRDPRQTAQAGAATGDRRRTFPPDPAATGPAVTWWGKAWVAALEDLSLDPARLARGRAYADAGHVDTITVTPGRVVAYVRGSRARPYRAELRLRTLAPEDWDTFLDAAATDPAHLESLLAKTIPQALLDPASPLAAVPLLPATAGDLLPSCTCPDAGRPCKHAAALCYQVARIVDEDPFVVFLLRGRDEREILDALGHRNAARAATESRTPPAVPALAAREALSRPLGALPPAFPPPTHPGTPPSYPPPYVSGAPDPLTLDHLATDAAQRAHALLTTGADPFAHLTPWQDAVRIAAAQPGSGLTASTRSLYTSLTRALGRTPTDLAKAVAAWRQGGTEALTVLDTPWDPPAGPFDRARSTLLVLGLNFRPAHNRLTAGRFQLRYGQDALWYGYASEQGADDWWPEGPSGPDPVDVLNRLRGT